GRILEDDILMGESYDARQELVGWQSAGPGEGRWEEAKVFADPGVEISPVLDGAVRSHEDLTATAEPRKDDQNRYLFDFGQNLAGTVTLKVKAPAGTTLKLRYGEMLDSSGELYVDN